MTVDGLLIQQKKGWIESLMSSIYEGFFKRIFNGSTVQKIELLKNSIEKSNSIELYSMKVQENSMNLWKQDCLQEKIKIKEKNF